MGFCTPDSFLLPIAEHKCQPTDSLHCGFHPHSDPLLHCRDSSLRVSSSQFRWWVRPSLGSNRESNSAAGFPPLGYQKFASTTDGTTPLKNTAGLLNHSQDKPFIPVTESSIPKRRDHYDSKKPMLKQARQDLNNHFHSKAIYVFYSEKSLHFDFILSIHTWFYFTRVIQSLITLLCLHF